VVKALHSEAERFQKDSRHSKCFSNRRLATSLREKPIHDHTSSKFITNSSGHDEHDWKAQKQLLPSVSKADSGGMRSMLLVADESWDVVTLIYIFIRYHSALLVNLWSRIYPKLLFDKTHSEFDTKKQAEVHMVVFLCW
jgi:hypothetical protein